MTLRARLLAAFAYVLVLVIVALEVPLALNLSRRVDAEVKSEAQGQAQLLAAGVSGRLSSRADLARLVTSSAGDLGGRVIVVDARGLLLADSAGPGLRSTSYASRPEIAAALEGRSSQGKRRSESLDEELLVTSVPVLRAGRPEGAVRVSQSVDAVDREVRNDVLALVGVGAMALLLGLAAAWLLAGSLARPLRALAGTARRVGAGDLEARAKPEGSREQVEVAAAFNDMTARLGRALRAQREFVGNASHQLRTPLTGLRLRLEAAGHKSSNPDVQRELAAAERETERLARLLGELLALARQPDSAEGSPLVVGDEVEAAVDRWRGVADQSGHQLQVDGGGPVVVASARADLGVILDNLIENAIHYSPAGTRVTLDWREHGRHGVLAVSDQGPGLPEGEEARVFGRFYRGAGSGAVEGTGLGLALVRALARRWGGDAEVENLPTGGLRAEVRLPLAAEHSPDPHLAERLPGGS